VTVRLRLVLAITGGVVLAARRGVAVRAIRELDRRGGLAAARGERAYAGIAPVFGRLHARAVADAAASGANTIVDVGAGPGDVVAALRTAAPAATVIGVEPSEPMRTLAAARGIKEIDGSAEALPLPDASADLVISTLSMHHWGDPARALAEIRRVLRPGGEARICDVRFAACGPGELAGFARSAGLPAASIGRTTLPERLLGLRPYVLISVKPPKEVASAG
jgi:SAM-dependent methyltransferase